MKINLDQLSQHVKKDLQAIYLVMGDEPLLVEETCDYLKKLCVTSGFEAQPQLTADNKFDWHQLITERDSLSLFSEKKLIDLRITSGKPGKVGGQILIEFAKQQDSNTILLVRLPKLSTASQKSKWFTQLESRGLAITIWPIRIEQFPHWLNRRLQRAKLHTDKAGLKLLAELTEGNLLAAKQSIEKLALQYDTGEISANQMEQALSDNSHFDVYHLLQAILKQDYQRSHKVLQKLKAMSTEPNLILWIITKQLRILADAARAKQDKQNLNDIWQQYGVWRNQQPLLTQHLNSYTYSDYLNLLQQAAIVDRVIKGAATGNPWHHLQQLVLNMSHNASNQGKAA